MPKYKILSEEIRKDGSIFDVELIPDQGLSEVQRYFVGTKEDKDKILSAAAWNHSDELASREEAANKPSEDKEPQEIDAMAKEALWQ